MFRPLGWVKDRLCDAGWHAVHAVEKTADFVQSKSVQNTAAYAGLAALPVATYSPEPISKSIAIGVDVASGATLLAGQIRDSGVFSGPKSFFANAKTKK